MPSLTKPLMLRISPRETDSLPFKALFDSSGVLGRETAGMLFNREESFAIVSPNRSVSIHLAGGGIVRESIPIIPDVDDDYREARA